MRGSKIAILILFALFISRRAGAEAPPSDAPETRPAQASPRAGADSPEAAIEKAQESVRRLAQALLSELTRALDAGPPEQAVRVCHQVAQQMTEELAAKQGLHLRRTALRVRNPKNAPDEFERRALEAWSSAETAPQPRHEVVSTAQGGRELRYLQPILLQPLCTACHGPAEEISPEVRAALAELYPEDRATGFRPGELRGAVSVRVPLGAGPD
jgi:hypothetical protein